MRSAGWTLDACRLMRGDPFTLDLRTRLDFEVLRRADQLEVPVAVEVGLHGRVTEWFAIAHAQPRAHLCPHHQGVGQLVRLVDQVLGFVRTEAVPAASKRDRGLSRSSVCDQRTRPCGT